MVAAVEQMASDPSPSREGHQERLEEIYCSLLGPAAAARGRYCGKRAGACRGRQRAALHLPLRRRGDDLGRPNPGNLEGPGLRRWVVWSLGQLTPANAADVLHPSCCSGHLIDIGIYQGL